MRLTTLLFLFVSAISFSQDFPKDWVGEYSGEMIAGSTMLDNDTVAVDFEIKEIVEDSIWTYKMTYHSDKFGEIVKDYRIVAEKIGDQKNFIFDELNGIKMQMSYLNGVFYGMYEVMGSAFVSSMRFLGDQLFIELIIASMDDPMVTGTSEDGEKTIEAKSFKPGMHQTVFLTKN